MEKYCSHCAKRWPVAGLKHCAYCLEQAKQRRDAKRAATPAGQCLVCNIPIEAGYRKCSKMSGETCSERDEMARCTAPTLFNLYAGLENETPVSGTATLWRQVCLLRGIAV